MPQRLVMASLVSQCRDYLGLPGKTVLLCREGHSLQSSVHHYLSTCGLTVHTTFGLPQTSGLLTANIPKRFCKLGTVGKQLPGLSLNLKRRKEAEAETEAETEMEDAGDKDSEMRVSGRNIFMGYLSLNREEEMKVRLAGSSNYYIGQISTSDLFRPRPRVGSSSVRRRPLTRRDF